MNALPIAIFEVGVTWVADQCPDTSYLEQEGLEDRLAAYHNGDFGFIGIQAEATVGYRLESGAMRLEKFTSGGLWGIEDDSSRTYLNEVACDELDELKAHLETFGIDTSDWPALTAGYPVRPSPQAAEDEQTYQSEIALRRS